MAGVDRCCLEVALSDLDDFVRIFTLLIVSIPLLFALAFFLMTIGVSSRMAARIAYCSVTLLYAFAFGYIIFVT